MTKEQRKIVNKRWYLENRDRKLLHNMKRTGGILPKEVNYQQLFNEQAGCCKLCGVHQTELKKALYVDHNHTTGKIRGLLCNNCNSAIGLFKENTTVLQKAIEYLRPAS